MTKNIFDNDEPPPKKKEEPKPPKKEVEVIKNPDKAPKQKQEEKKVVDAIKADGRRIDDINTLDLFDILSERCVNEGAEVMISKAKDEFEALADRIGDNEARTKVGEMIVASIRAKLLAGKGAESGASTDPV